MTEEIAIIRIIGGGAGGVTGGAGGSGGSLNNALINKGIPNMLGSSAGFRDINSFMKDMKPEAVAGKTGTVMSGILKGLGIASGIGIIVSMVSNFKYLINMVEMVLKMVAFLFNPIAMIVTVLLLPILLILKPIVQAIHQMMMPFIKMAMGLMRESASAYSSGDTKTGASKMLAGAGVMMIGLQAVIQVLFTDLVFFLIKAIGNMLAAIGDGIDVLIRTLTFGQVNTSIGDSIRTIITEAEKGVDAFKTGILLNAGNTAIELAKAVGADDGIISNFRSDISTSITNLFGKDNQAVNAVATAMGFGEFGFGAALVNNTKSTLKSVTTNADIDTAFSDFGLWIGKKVTGSLKDAMDAVEIPDMFQRTPDFTVNNPYRNDGTTNVNIPSGAQLYPIQAYVYG